MKSTHVFGTMRNGRAARGPYLVLLLGLLITGLAAYYAWVTVEARGHLRFQHAVEQASVSIQARMDTYIALLRAGGGLFAASHGVSGDEFREFVNHLDLRNRYPGVQGIGFSLRIRPEEQSAWLAGEQRGIGAGIHLWPEGEREEYHAVIYLEPLDARNRAALGFDMFTEPVRREAMERARDTGLPATSGVVKLKQEIDGQPQPGFLIYYPVYRNGQARETIEERRAALVGYVYSPFRAGDLFGLGDELIRNASVNFQVYDGEPRADNLLYASSVAEVGNASKSYSPRRMMTGIQVGGRDWSLVFTTTPSFEALNKEEIIYIVPLGGLLITLALFAIIRAQARARTSAERTSEELLASQTALQARLRQQAALGHLGKKAYTGASIDEVMHEAVRVVAETLGIEYCRVLELQSDGRFTLRTGFGWRKGLEGQTFIEAGTNSHAHYALSSGTPVIVEDYRTEQRLKPAPLLLEHGVISGISTVIEGNGHHYGELGAHSTRQRAFTEEDTSFVQAVANILANTLKRQRAEDAFQRRLKAEEMIAHISAQFINLSDFDQAVSAALKDLGETANATHVWLCLLRENEEVADCTHEWVAPGREPKRFELQNIAYDNFFKWWWDKLRTGSVVRLRHIPELSDDLPVARKVLERVGAKSSLAIPVKDRDKLRGCLIFNNAGSSDIWSEENEGLLHFTASIIGSTLQRRQAEQALKASEDQLRQALKMEAVGQLAGGIAHDFNNLLAVIMLHGDLLLRRLDEESPEWKRTMEIKSAAERAARLTRQLLAFSRKQVMQPVVLNLNESVMDMDKMLRRVISENIEFLTDMEPSLGLVMADGGQMEQVLMNLSVNARDAMPQGGRLTISTKNVFLSAGEAQRLGSAPEGNYVMLSVSDTGCGMDAGIMAHIFEPFFTTKGVGKGTGLGLSTVYGIITQSGGYVTVESEPDNGTTFYIYLPRIDSEVKRLTAAESEPELRGGWETILLVEDEEMVRNATADLLRMHGYKVLVAADGMEALDISAKPETEIHLVLTDVVMPRLSGRDLAKRLQSLRPGVKVLYMSGYSDEVISHQGVLEEGAIFLEKPFTPRALLQKIRDVLDLN